MEPPESKLKTNTMKFLFIMIIAMTLTPTLVSGEENLSKKLLLISSTLNENLPFMVDSDTRLDSTIGINKQFQYNYTLVNYTSDKLLIEQIINNMTTELTNKVCTSHEMLFFIENDILLIYAYFGKNGKRIATIEIPTSQCKDKKQPKKGVRI